MDTDNCDLQAIARLISPHRLVTLSANDGDCPSALQAFNWEFELRQALLKPIGLTEIVVRNAVDASIQSWWSGQGLPGYWTDSAEEAPELLRSHFNLVAWRKKVSKRLSKPVDLVTHDDMIAHSGLGSWKSSIGNPAFIPSRPPENDELHSSWRALRAHDARCAELWVNATRDAFALVPNTKRQRGGLSPRGYIGARLTRITNLRNRICHWDNLVKVNIPDRYLDCVEVLDAVNSDVAQWARELCDEDVMCVLQKRPSWL